jgi:hypothetical protein
VVTNSSSGANRLTSFLSIVSKDVIAKIILLFASRTKFCKY